MEPWALAKMLVLNLTNKTPNIHGYITYDIIKLLVITSQFEHKRHTVISHVKLSVELQVKANGKSSAYH